MKVGLVLEGGGMRALFTAGVLDALLDVKELDIDGIVGVSAGALFGANYVSGQKERAIRYNKKYARDKRYMGLHSWITTGNAVNKEFAFYEIPFKLDVFDQEKFKQSKIDFYVVMTNVENGQAEYVLIEDVFEQMEYLRATSALPFASKIIEINGKKYLDGGISDSIPIDYCQSLGYDKIILVLTRPENTYKEDKLNFLYKLVYRKYPNLVKRLINMGKDYEVVLKKIKDLENEKIEILRQYKKIDVLVILKNSKKAYIIEDKTYTSEHSEQIKRYRENIQNDFKEEINNIKTVYFKTGFWFSYDYHIVNEKDKIDIKINREDFLKIISKYKGKNLILDDYCEYFERVTENEEKEKNYLINEEEIKEKGYWGLNISKSSISQYQFMGDIFSDGYIESGRSVGGRPYTQFNILRSIFPNKDNENLSEDKRNYTIFWRVDTVNVGPYISINFYTHHDKNNDPKPQSRIYEYNRIKEKIEKIVKEKCSNILNWENIQGKFSNYWEQNLLIIPLKDYLISKEKCDKLVECIRIIDGELRK